ncbi:MAG: class I SAM-dependent methyltransferase [Candidatus Geothermincolia bacterium]
MRGLPRRDARARFDQWAATYEGSYIWRHFFMPLHDMLEERVTGVRDANILDLGSGTGDMLRRFEEAGASRLVGLDESEGMVKVARELSEGCSRIEYIHASVESIPATDEEFDIIVSCIAFHHFPDPLGALEDIQRALKPGGRLYLCDMTDKGILGRSMLAYGRMKRADEHYYNVESITRMAREAGLEIVSTEYVRHFPPTMLLIAARRKE